MTVDPMSMFAPLVDNRDPAATWKPGQTAQEFEVLLVKQLLDDLPMPGLEGTEAGTFLSLIHEALARQLVEQGHGMGLATQLAPYTSRDGSVASSGFGWRTDPFDGDVRHHAGVDLPAPTGTPIGAALAGVVSFAAQTEGYGNLVVIDHADGLQTAYAHCDTIEVSEGDQVEAGFLVGTVGSTGRSTGPHVHFEVRQDGQAVDPVSAGVRAEVILAR